MIPPHRYSDAVSTRLAEGFLQGGSLPPVAREARVELANEFPGTDIDPALLAALQHHVLGLSPDAKPDERNATMDQWLAPRLHAALRIPRRLAADRGFWAWLAIDHFADFVHLRWRPSDGAPTSAWRFTGEVLRNGVARLWWGAEMVRNGNSYEYVPLVFGRVRTAQFALELRYSHHRPAAIAFTRVVERWTASEALEDERMKATSKRINAQLTTRSLEAIAGFHDADEDPPDDWYRDRPSLESLTADELPVGPETDAVPEEALVRLEAWFRSLVPPKK